MNTFVKAASREANLTATENGATALSTTENAVLDLFSTIGALRNASEDRVVNLWKAAFKENPALAMRTLFYARDVRGGLGERETFRTILKHLAQTAPEYVKENIALVGYFGRFDDLYSLVGTPCEEAMWSFMKDQFKMDLAAMSEGKSVSLLAKWIKTPDASSDATRKMGIQTALKLGYNVKTFKKDLRTLRKYLDIPEIKMCANEWDTICYKNVSANCMMKNRNTFKSHDETGFKAYLDNVKKGKTSIKAGTLYPYDIVEKYLYGRESDNDVLNLQWEALPNYAEDENVLIMADVSGSMTGRPMATSIGMAMYFAERNKGDFHGLFMTFSGEPDFVKVKGSTIADRIRNISRADWGMNTNLDAAMSKVLSLAKKSNIAKEDMPKAFVIISDMEIDRCAETNNNELFYDRWKEKFEDAGYDVPSIVFWNVNSRHDIYHSDSNIKGVQYYSGQSVSVFKNIFQGIEFNPVEAMMSVLMNERYDVIVSPEGEKENALESLEDEEMDY